MKLKIIHTAHHRNGVHGASFDLVLFKDRGPERSRKIGILFEQPHHCAVLDVAKLAQGDIAFGSNSWRGDEYEPDLRKAIDGESLTATAESLTIDFEPERLQKAAPRLLAALAAILPYAENESQSLYECWKRDGNEVTKEALDACERAIEQARAVIAAAETDCPRCESDGLDIHAVLAVRRQIAAGWSIDDVREIRPDLTDEQAWDVLQAVERNHDATIGINWDVLDYHAERLFGDGPETDEAEEA
ncbi:MAG: hypothetical protein WCB27_25385 [Thermoguttaceae bacterium]